MILRALLALSTLAVLARAQSVPAEPTPSESAQAIDAQAAKDPAAAGAALNDLFRRLAAPRVVLPTWAEIQQDRARRDLAAVPSFPEPLADPAGRAPLDPHDRITRESVDVIASRPLARVGLGAGWSAIGFYKNDERVAGLQAKYLLLSVDLARVVRPARAVPPPVVVEHSLTEAGPTRVLVQSESYAVDALKLPKD